MKKTFILSIGLFLNFCLVHSQISTFPYIESFESNDGGWTTSGTNSSWQWGTPNGTFINSASHGTKAWVTNLSGLYNASESSYLTTPVFDFSSIQSIPILSFDFKLQSETNYDYAYMEYSVDGGTNWHKIFPNNYCKNWYNHNNNDWMGTIGSTGWVNVSYMLYNLKGQANVRFRFYFYSDPSYQFEGVGIDNFKISLPDLAIQKIVAPNSSHHMSNSETLTVRFRNNTNNTLNNVQVSYRFDGGAKFVETIPSINAGEEVNFSFSSLIDCSSEIIHKLDIFTPFDSLKGYQLVNLSNNAYPLYHFDFETSPQGWTAGGNTVTWQWGNPNPGKLYYGTEFIYPSGGGNFSWITAPGGNYLNNNTEYLESPTLDFSNISVDPYISFSHILKTETNYDYAYVEYSTDNGTTWRRLGVQNGEGNNWYNHNTNRWNNELGPARQWKISNYQLRGLAGEANVKFRFYLTSDAITTFEGWGLDDIAILVPDIQILNINAPVSGTNLPSNGTISIKIVNNTSNVKNNVPVSYQINNGAIVNETIAVLQPNDTIDFVFSQSYDFSQVGHYKIDVWCNWLPFITIKNYQIANVANVASSLYFFNFENNAQGWTASGTNSSWEWGFPLKNSIPRSDFISCSGGELNCWTTKLYGTYNADELSYLTSPILDFSQFNSDPVISFSNIFKTEGYYDYSKLQYSIDGGQTWSVVGNIGEGINWYNANTTNGPGWTGTVGNPDEWKISSIRLTGTKGYSDVRLRFLFKSDPIYQFDGVGIDNIAIHYLANDIKLVAVTNPVSGCQLGQQVIKVKVKNVGTNPVSGFNVFYSVNNGPVISETVNLTLNSNDTLIYTFSQPFDFGSSGTFNIKSWISLIDDEDRTNDTIANYVVTSNTNSLTSNLPDDTSSCTQVVLDPQAGNHNYLWSNNTTNNTITVNQSGLYTVTITDNNGCMLIDSCLVTIHNTYLAQYTYSICQGDTVWFGQDYYVDSGTYTHNYTDIYGCDSTIILDITVHPLPIIGFNNSTIYTQQPDTIILDAGTGYASYLWQDNSTSQYYHVASYGTFWVIVTDANGCSSSDTIHVEMLTSTDISTIRDFIVYPVPANNYLTLEFRNLDNQEVIVSIFNTIGETVKSIHCHEIIIKIDVSHLSNGVYLIEAAGENNIVRKYFSIQH